MRILFHHRTLGDGAEGIHIAEMVSAFRTLGHEVHVQGGEPATARENNGGIVDACRHALPDSAVQAAAVAHNALEFMETSRRIARFKPELLYARHGRYALGALAAARRHGLPSVLEVNVVYSAKPYSDFESLVLPAVAKRLERRAFEVATTITAVSTPLARQVDELAHRRAYVVPNGVDPQRFDPGTADPHRIRSRYGLESKLVVGWSGILRPWHGLELLLDAVASLDGAVLLIVGDGPDRPVFERLAARAGVRDRVVITGRVPHAEMPDYLAAFDVAAVAHDRTGVACPMKLLEYMAMGRAIVAPRLENIRDVVEDEWNGLLFDPSRDQSLREVLCRAAADVRLRTALGRRARWTVEERRNWRSNVEAVLDLAGVRTV